MTNNQKRIIFCRFGGQDTQHVFLVCWKEACPTYERSAGSFWKGERAPLSETVMVGSSSWTQENKQEG